MADTPVCLLLPGTLCDARLFAPLQAAWAALGHAPVQRVADLHQLPMGLEAWWDAQLSGLTAPVDVLGFSLGGVLALQLLARAPQRVRRLVLVASNPMPGTPMHRERVQAQQAQWHAQGPQAVADAMLDQASPGATPEVRALVRAMAADTPVAAFDAQGELNATRPDGAPALARWRGPLLLVSGQRDPWCGDDKQALLRQARPDALWHALPDAGHYLPLERAQALAQVSAEFFRSSDLS